MFYLAHCKQHDKNLSGKLDSRTGKPELSDLMRNVDLTSPKSFLFVRRLKIVLRWDGAYIEERGNKVRTVAWFRERYANTPWGVLSESQP